jgi:hypothetical protein
MHDPSGTATGVVYVLADPDTAQVHHVTSTTLSAGSAGKRLVTLAREHDKEGKVYDWIRSLGDRDPWIVTFGDRVPASVLNHHRQVWRYVFGRLGAPLITEPPKTIRDEDADLLAEARRYLEENKPKQECKPATEPGGNREPTGIKGRGRDTRKAVAEAINRRRFRCDECGMVANPGALGSHQRRSGHRGRTRLEDAE